MRAGARALNLLGAPLNSQVLQALSDGPKQLAELRRATGHPAQTTLRAQLRKLHKTGIVEKRRRDSFPGVVEYELSDAGGDLLPVAATLDRWLEQAPEGPHELGSPSAKTAIKALAEGWSTTMLRALAAKPLTLTELDGLITSLNYPSVERRLAAMRLAGLVSAREGNERGTPYGLSRWGREAIAPIAAALRWERQRLPDSAEPLGRLDVETAFLMGVPLLEPGSALSGSCRMAVELAGGDSGSLCGVTVSADGRIASCTTRQEGDPEAWASGRADAWLAALIDGALDGLELSSDGALARDLIEELHRTLFGVRTR